MATELSPKRSAKAFLLMNAVVTLPDLVFANTCKDMSILRNTATASLIGSVSVYLNSNMMFK